MRMGRDDGRGVTTEKSGKTEAGWGEFPQGRDVCVWTNLTHTHTQSASPSVSHSHALREVGSTKRSAHSTHLSHDALETRSKGAAFQENSSQVRFFFSLQASVVKDTAQGLQVFLHSSVRKFMTFHCSLKFINNIWGVTERPDKPGRCAAVRLSLQFFYTGTFVLSWMKVKYIRERSLEEL